MAFQVLSIIFYKAQLYNRLTLHQELPTILNQLTVEEKEKRFKLEKVNLEEKIRPSVQSISKYLEFDLDLQKSNIFNLL